MIRALLPAVYWQQQAQKTRTPALRAIYQPAAQHAEQTLNAHPFSAELTPDDYHDWWGVGATALSAHLLRD